MVGCLTVSPTCSWTSSPSSPTTVGATAEAHVPPDGSQPRPRSRPTTPLHCSTFSGRRRGGLWHQQWRVFALEMVIRHPASVLSAVLHEPALVVLFDDPAQVRGIVTAAVEEGMRLGGRRLGWSGSYGSSLATSRNWNGLDSSLRAGRFCPVPTPTSTSRSASSTSTCPTPRRWPGSRRRSSWSSATEACPTSPKRQPGSHPVSASMSHQRPEPTSRTSITPKNSPIR